MKISDSINDFVLFRPSNENVVKKTRNETRSEINIYYY